jgi:hypothetical protein
MDRVDATPVAPPHRSSFAAGYGEGCAMGNHAVVALVCLLGIALSVRSIVVLGRAAPWTSAGWCLTLVYFAALIGKATVALALPGYVEYLVLAALAIVFLVAGVRDERQAEPWWWPNRRGPTRAEKRNAT